MKGRKFEIVSFLNEDSTSFYGAKIGDVVVLGDTPDHMVKYNMDSIWAYRSDNEGVFTNPSWEAYETLCICNNQEELNECFKEIV